MEDREGLRLRLGLRITSKNSLGIAGEPESDGAGLGIVGIGFEDFQVMGTCFGGFVKLLRVEIAESKMGATVVGIFFQQLFKFDHRPGEVVVLLE